MNDLASPAPPSPSISHLPSVSEVEYLREDFYFLNLNDPRFGSKTRTPTLADRWASIKATTDGAPSSPSNGSARRVLLHGRCDMCGRLGDDIVLRPLEGGKYCAACCEENDLCALAYNKTTGDEELVRSHCFVCDLSLPTARAARQHFGSKIHRKRLRDLHSVGSFSEPTDTGCAAPLAAAQALVDAECAVRWSLGFFPQFRLHVPEHEIELLPPMFLTNALTAFEQAILESRQPQPNSVAGAMMAQQRTLDEEALYPTTPHHVPSVHEAMRSLEMALTGGGRRQGPLPPEAMDFAKHVYPGMPLADLHLLFDDLRREVFVGFDTETAPPSFFSAINAVVPGPHLVQIATADRVWLVSLVPPEARRVVGKVHSLNAEREKQQRRSFEQELGLFVSAKQKQLHASTHQHPRGWGGASASLTTLNDEEESFNDGFSPRRSRQPEAASLPAIQSVGMAPPPPPPTSLPLCPPATPQAKQQILLMQQSFVQRRVPLFLEQFLRRPDVLLVGFGLQSDHDLLSRLFDTFSHASSGSSSATKQCVVNSATGDVLPLVPFARMLDLGQCFLTDPKSVVRSVGSLGHPMGCEWKMLCHPLDERSEQAEPVLREASKAPDFAGRADLDAETVDHLLMINASIAAEASALAEVCDDIKDTEEQRQRANEAKAARLAALGTVQSKAALGRNVGAVQAAARVLSQRYFKPKRLSTSNWAIPTQMMRAGQLVYACRDAMLPLILLEKLRAHYTASRAQRILLSSQCKENVYRDTPQPRQIFSAVDLSASDVARDWKRPDSPVAVVETPPVLLLAP
jgi:hypothetical protein